MYLFSPLEGKLPADSDPIFVVPRSMACTLEKLNKYFLNKGMNYRLLILITDDLKGC